MSIAPILQSVRVKASPQRAFELFTGRMGDWWPRQMAVGTAPFVAIEVEPRVGGRWFERDADGNEAQWGEVLAWEPPARLLLAWQLDGQFVFDPNHVTEVELTFEPVDGGTQLTLEHRNLERFGTATALLASMDSGWRSIIEQFATFAQNEQ